MNGSLFIAKRFFRSKKGKGRNPAIRIAVIGIAFGLIIMMISTAIALGFKHQISSKVIGVGGHLQIMNANVINENEHLPFILDNNLKQTLKNNNFIDNYESFSDIMGIIKTNDDFKGIMLRGYDLNSNTSFIKQHLIKGQFLSKSGKYEVVISEKIAKQLSLKIGTSVYSYFFDESIKTRKLKIVGIYKTNMMMFDDNLIFTHKSVVNGLMHWNKKECSNISINLKDFSKIEKNNITLNELIRNHKDAKGNSCKVLSIKRLYSQIFNWLGLMDLNITVIIILMIFVSGFTMISGLLILILEKAQTIGILKSMGASNFFIQKTFLYYAAILIGKGMIIGNIITLALCFIQIHFGVIKLDPSVYYLDKVPIEINIPYFILINIGTFIITLLSLIIPSFLIARIKPANSMKFE